ncbi:hypothetical protein SPFM15_00208 [Salmonella phage SPFM15]|nr:hypothetical protein SPFM5_00203 [Salmonella phage SPFM5]VFR13832.1 hypothetical protein SPFM15_00208 [Salmonella phage SPFM15]
MAAGVALVGMILSDVRKDQYESRAYQRKDSSELEKERINTLNTIQTNELKLRLDEKKNRQDLDYRTQLNNLAPELRDVRAKLEATYQAKLQDPFRAFASEDEARRYRWLDNIGAECVEGGKMIMYSFDDPMSLEVEPIRSKYYDEGIYMVIGVVQKYEDPAPLKWLRFYTTMDSEVIGKPGGDRKEFALGVVGDLVVLKKLGMAFSTQPVKLTTNGETTLMYVVDDIGALMRLSGLRDAHSPKQYAQICKELAAEFGIVIYVTYTVFANGANPIYVTELSGGHFVLAPSSTTRPMHRGAVSKTITYENNTGFLLLGCSMNRYDLDVQPTLTQ